MKTKYQTINKYKQTVNQYKQVLKNVYTAITYVGQINGI